MRPRNERYLEQQAELALRQNAPHVAIKAYQRLVQLKPTWAFYWANIASLMLEYDYYRENRNAFDLAWDRTLEAGPYEYDLQRKLLSQVVPRWYALNSDQRKDVLALVQAHCRYRALEGKQLKDWAISPRVNKLVSQACENGSS